MKKLSLAFFFQIIAVGVYVGLAFAQPAPEDPKSTVPKRTADDEKFLETSEAPANLAIDTKVDPKRNRYVSLYIGIEYQERLEYLPQDFTVKGDFRKIARVSISRETNTLLFSAISEGVGSLTIHDKKGNKLYEYRIDTKKSNLTKVAREVRSLLSDIEGITIKIVNNRVVVDGQVLLPRDMNRIHSVIKQYGPLAGSLVTISPVAQKKIAQLIAQQIGNPEITVMAVNDKFILEGISKSADEKTRAETIAKTYVPDIIKTECEGDGLCIPNRKELVVNLIQVPPDAPKEPGKVIELVVHYVELNKNYQKSFKFDWSPGLADGSNVQFTSDSRAPGGVVSTITGTISNLLPKLNWAKQYGHARVLQSTSLIVLDGQKGDIKSVTRIPYITSGAENTSTTQFEEAGIVSSITPQIQNARSDVIKLSMKFSMASLLGITASGPMISKNEVETQIVVRSGQSAAVGGLISNNTNTDYNKLPQGGNNNPIFTLLASKSFLRNQSQFVVFITPVIKSSASSGAERIKQKFRLRD